MKPMLILAEILLLMLVALIQLSCAGPRLGGLVESSVSPAEHRQVSGLSYRKSLRITFPSGIGKTRPSGVAVLPGGGLAVLDGDAGVAALFSQTGQFISYLEAPGTFHPSSLAVGPALSLYLVDSATSEIYRFDSTGHLAGLAYSAGESPHFVDICFDKAGHAYLSDLEGDEVRAIDPALGTERRLGGFGAGSGLFVDPAGLALDEGNLLYVCDWGNSRLQVLDQWGGVVKVWPLDAKDCVPRPRDLAVDLWGNVFVTDEGCQCLRVIGSDGVEGFRLEGKGPGLSFLEEPAGLDVDSGRLYIADSPGGEIQIFEILYETYR